MCATKKLPRLYLILAYGLSWLCWIPVVLTGIDYQTSPLLVFLVLLGAFGPFLSGIILVYRQGDWNQRRDFWERILDIRRIRPAWIALILLIWPVLQLLAVLLDRVLGGGVPDFQFVKGMLEKPLGILVVPVLYFIQAAVEEPGWRGTMLEKMLPAWGSVKASWAVGIFHALWHLPLFFMNGTDQVEMGLDMDFLFFTAQVIASSFITTWCYTSNRHSILAVSFLHFTGNFTGSIFGILPGTSKFYIYILVLAAAAALVGVMKLGKKYIRAVGLQ